MHFNRQWYPFHRITREWIIQTTRNYPPLCNTVPSTNKRSNRKIQLDNGLENRRFVERTQNKLGRSITTGNIQLQFFNPRDHQTSTIRNDVWPNRRPSIRLSTKQCVIATWPKPFETIRKLSVIINGTCETKYHQLSATIKTKIWQKPIESVIQQRRTGPDQDNQSSLKVRRAIWRTIPNYQSIRTENFCCSTREKTDVTPASDNRCHVAHFRT